MRALTVAVAIGVAAALGTAVEAAPGLFGRSSDVSTTAAFVDGEYCSPSTSTIYVTLSALSSFPSVPGAELPTITPELPAATTTKTLEPLVTATRTSKATLTNVVTVGMSDSTTSTTTTTTTTETQIVYETQTQTAGVLGLVGSSSEHAGGSSSISSVAASSEVAGASPSISTTESKTVHETKTHTASASVSSSSEVAGASSSISPLITSEIPVAVTASQVDTVYITSTQSPVVESASLTTYESTSYVTSVPPARVVSAQFSTYLSTEMTTATITYTHELPQPPQTESVIVITSDVTLIPGPSGGFITVTPSSSSPELETHTVTISTVHTVVATVAQLSTIVLPAVTSAVVETFTDTITPATTISAAPVTLANLETLLTTYSPTAVVISTPVVISSMTPFGTISSSLFGYMAGGVSATTRVLYSSAASLNVSTVSATSSSADPMGTAASLSKVPFNSLSVWGYTTSALNSGVASASSTLGSATTPGQTTALSASKGYQANYTAVSSGTSSMSASGSAFTTTVVNSTASGAFPNASSFASSATAQVLRLQSPRIRASTIVAPAPTPRVSSGSTAGAESSMSASRATSFIVPPFESVSVSDSSTTSLPQELTTWNPPYNVTIASATPSASTSFGPHNISVAVTASNPTSSVTIASATSFIVPPFESVSASESSTTSLPREFTTWIPTYNVTIASATPSASASFGPYNMSIVFVAGPSITVLATDVPIVESGNPSPSKTTNFQSGYPSMTSAASTLPTPTTSSKVITFATTTSSGPAPSSTCGEHGEFILNFDDIPTTVASDNKTEPVFSPYHQFDFSAGFDVPVGSGSKFLPSSGTTMLKFASDVNQSLTTPAVPVPGGAADRGVTGSIGLGYTEQLGCFNFNAYGASVGCDANEGEQCSYQIIGVKYNAATEGQDVVASQVIPIMACPTDSKCTLVPIRFYIDTFVNLTSIYINATVNGVPSNWYMDDLDLEWTDNSCDAGLCRQSNP